MARDNAQKDKGALTLPISSRATPPAVETVVKRKRITLTTSDELESRYLIGGDPDAIKFLPPLPESCHYGMEVLYATRYADGETVVVKTRDRQSSFRNLRDEAEWRATTEYQLNIPAVDTLCQYYEVLETREMYYVFMERVEGTDLFEVVLHNNVSHEDSREIIGQILEGLAALHNRGRIHKDLKLENVMVELDSPRGRLASRRSKVRAENQFGPLGSPVAKVIDFDTVEEWPPQRGTSSDVLGSDGYIAPEAYEGIYSPSSDIYAVGVMMYKLLTGHFPMASDIFDDQPGENYVGSPAMRRIQQRLRTVPICFAKSPLDVCPAAAELVKAMLSVDPEDRPTAQEACDHAWFKLDVEALPAKKPSRHRKLTVVNVPTIN